MLTKKIAVSIDERVLNRLEELIREAGYPNRSRSVEDALRDKIERAERSRLAREVSKLDPEVEQRVADESLERDANEWPEY